MSVLSLIWISLWVFATAMCVHLRGWGGAALFGLMSVLFVADEFISPIKKSKQV